MARKRYSYEDVLKLVREIELKLACGDDLRKACRSVGVSDAIYCSWRRQFGGIAIGAADGATGVAGPPQDSESCGWRGLARAASR